MSGDRLDEVFSALADERRRQTLHYLLAAPDAVVPVDSLVTSVATAADIDRERAAIALHHFVLPKLEEAGLVAYNRQRATVQYRGHPLVTWNLRLIDDR